MCVCVCVQGRYKSRLRRRRNDTVQQMMGIIPSTCCFCTHSVPSMFSLKGQQECVCVCVCVCVCDGWRKEGSFHTPKHTQPHARTHSAPVTNSLSEQEKRNFSHEDEPRERSSVWAQTRSLRPELTRLSVLASKCVVLKAFKRELHPPTRRRSFQSCKMNLWGWSVGTTAWNLWRRLAGLYVWFTVYNTCHSSCLNFHSDILPSHEFDVMFWGFPTELQIVDLWCSAKKYVN